MGRLDGKVAFITGGGTGIGRGVAELFALEGCKVVISGRREEPLRKVAAQVPDQISFVQMDLANKLDRIRSLETAIDRHGRLDILVNNAADQTWKPFVDYNDEDIERVIHTNLVGTTSLIRLAIPHLQRTKGNIVNTSAAAARYVLVPSHNLTVYSATKAGINQLTRSLAVELGPLGVRINAVAPGATSAETGDNFYNDPEIRNAILSATALGRVGEPIDIARVILFVASEQAGWVTGQVIDASGGFWIAS